MVKAPWRLASASTAVRNPSSGVIHSPREHERFENDSGDMAPVSLERSLAGGNIAKLSKDDPVWQLASAIETGFEICVASMIGVLELEDERPASHAARDLDGEHASL
jgi:hypothetical protein